MNGDDPFAPLSGLLRELCPVPSTPAGESVLFVSEGWRVYRRDPERELTMPTKNPGISRDARGNPQEYFSKKITQADRSVPAGAFSDYRDTAPDHNPNGYRPVTPVVERRNK